LTIGRSSIEKIRSQSAISNRKSAPRRSSGLILSYVEGSAMQEFRYVSNR
jgi:hypothetical protein